MILPSRPAAVAALLLAGQPVDVGGVDADREGLGADDPVVDLDPPVLALRSSGEVNKIAAEVRGVSLGLEPDEIEGAEPAGQPRVLR